MMRAYYWADICTMVRFACVGSLGVLACRGASAEVALLVFAVGELTDALDGGLARRFPYPNDGKYRWWRDAWNGRMPEIYDQVADIALALVALLYVGLNIHPGLALWLGGLGVCIAVPVQIWRAYRIHLIPDEDDDPLRVRVILVRRALYLAGIVVIIFAMLSAVADRGVRIWLICGGIIIAIILIFVKADRLQRDKPKK